MYENKIFDNLRDPSWWFTALFIAMLASLLASYLRDGVRTVMAYFSNRYRLRKEAKDRRTERIIATLAANASLLVISWIRAVAIFLGFQFLTILWLATTGFYFGFPSVQRGSPVFPVALLVGLAGAMFWAGYLAISKLRVVVQATKIYQHGIRVSPKKVERELSQ